jgi:hypothetical protein
MQSLSRTGTDFSVSGYSANFLSSKTLTGQISTHTPSPLHLLQSTFTFGICINHCIESDFIHFNSFHHCNQKIIVEISPKIVLCNSAWAIALGYKCLRKLHKQIIDKHLPFRESTLETYASYPYLVLISFFGGISTTLAFMEIPFILSLNSPIFFFIVSPSPRISSEGETNGKVEFEESIDGAESDVNIPLARAFVKAIRSCGKRTALCKKNWQF